MTYEKYARNAFIAQYIIPLHSMSSTQFAKQLKKNRSFEITKEKFRFQSSTLVPLRDQWLPGVEMRAFDINSEGKG